MAIMPAARDELEILRILDEGKFAEKKYILPEVLRRYNVSQAEYTSLRKKFTIPDSPVAFDSLELALSYIHGNYHECQLRISETGKFYVEAVVVEANHQESIQESVEESSLAKKNKRRYLSSDEVECIANELIEQKKTVNEIAKVWNTSPGTVYSIKGATHRYLNDKIKKDLASHFKVTKQAGAAAIPSAIQEKGKIKKAAKKEIELKKPAASVRTELVISHPQRDLDAVLRELRTIMRSQQIESVLVKSNGEITMMRKEIYRLDHVNSN